MQRLIETLKRHEGVKYYVYKDHLGYEIFSYGMDKAKVQKLLEIIHPKTNRGDWIRKKAKEAQGEETPTPSTKSTAAP